MVRLEKCCCCSLRTGALVIGYLNIASLLLYVVTMIAQLPSPTYMDKQLEIVIIVTVTVSCLALLVNSLMIYGLHQGKPGYLIAWLALKFLGLLAITVLVTIFSGKALYTGTDSSQYVIIFVVFPLFLALAWYLYLVVYSYYKELCDGPSHSRLQNTSYNYSDDQIVIVSEK